MITAGLCMTEMMQLMFCSTDHKPSLSYFCSVATQHADWGMTSPARRSFPSMASPAAPASSWLCLSVSAWVSLWFLGAPSPFFPLHFPHRKSICVATCVCTPSFCDFAIDWTASNDITEVRTRWSGLTQGYRVGTDVPAALKSLADESDAAGMSA